MSAVKIFAFLELEPRLNIKYGFNWAGKNEHFSKVSLHYFGITVNLIVSELSFLDTDYPDEIEKENAFHWAGTDYKDS